MFDLKGKVALITGASGGLGQGMAIALAQAGADIVGIGISNMSQTRAQIETLGRKFHEIHADLNSIEPIQSVIDEAVKVMGHIDILVNNSGIIKRNEALDFTESEWDSVMNVNIKSLFFMSQAFAKQIVKQKTPGKIINIASMLSFQGGIRVASYTSSKSGVKGLTMLLANEWAKYNINVNSIAPGYMATENTKALREDPIRNKEILNRIPLGRWGLPSDLGGPVVFLASKASDYVNGYTLAVDGGWLSR